MISTRIKLYYFYILSDLDYLFLENCLGVPKKTCTFVTAYEIDVCDVDLAVEPIIN